jgi:glutaredoxin
MMAKTARISLFLSVVLACSVACKESPKGAPSASPKTHRLDLRVPAQREGLSFRYFDATTRRFDTALERDRVPDAARRLVMVYDEALPPGTLKPGEMVLADLREPGEDGTFPTRVVNQAKSSRALAQPATVPAKAAATPGVAPTPADRPSTGLGERVILFVTSWCPHCRTAEAWFTKRGVAFLKMDVERRPGARDLLMKLFRDNEVPAEYANSVPIIAIDGEILLGFDPKEVQKRL